MATIVELLIAKNVFNIRIQRAIAMSQTVSAVVDAINVWPSLEIGIIHKVPIFASQGL